MHRLRVVAGRRMTPLLLSHVCSPHSSSCVRPLPPYHCISRRHTATTAAAAEAVSATNAAAKTSQAEAPSEPELKSVNFDDPYTYRTRSTWYLIKALAILKICSFEVIAMNAAAIMRATEKVLGSRLTYGVLVKRSFYNYFCAGENDKELKKSIQWLLNCNIGCVLDYAAEADAEGFAPSPGESEAPDVSMASLVVKPNINYVDREHYYNDNMKLYMMAIMHASLNSPRHVPGVTAMKVTGMCDPQLLARMSAILMSIHQSWCMHFTQEEDVPKLEECRVVMGVNHKHQLYITTQQLREGFDRYNPDMCLSDAQFDEVLKEFQPDEQGRINYFKYKDVLSEAVIELEPSPVQRALIDRLPRVSDHERKLWKAIVNRVSLIALAAKELHVHVLIDAEQTFYQLAIDALVGYLQKKYNTERPVVQNTYQCYLTYAEDRISNDLKRAREYNYQWGGKVVRGAYIIQERHTAKVCGYTSPIWSTYDETNQCYQAAAKRILRELEQLPDSNYEVFFGTHNRQSLEYITHEILTKPQLRRKVLFGQLYAMRDNLTIPLAKAGFNAYKYLPYGPVRDTVHYLCRRAVENSSILTGKDSDEVVMLRKELMRRLLFRRSKN